jgi:DNA-binding NarL/FixJ family response regulator
MEVRHCGSVREAELLLAMQPADVILLDFDLGFESAAGFLAKLRREGESVRVLMVTAGVSESQAAEMRALGATGIILKHESPQRLCQAVRDLIERDPPAEPAREAMAGETHTAPRKRSFTDRDRDVVRAVLQGLANKEIAARLDISESAVKASLQTLFAKMGVRSRSQLVRAALEEFRDVLTSRGV